ncbi:MAG TPA: peptidylprolyl isomerase [Polyangiaceae bacterium]|nr:peptidylprolyl isomerase [Polyangiaceae bacterium]
MLWVSHILVRDQTSTREAPFSAGDWLPLPPAPLRSRRDALLLATNLSRQLQARPYEFSDVAAKVSEDLVTRDRGGSLGGLSAEQLHPWPQVLDALAVLRPNVPSEPVETKYGFHILLLRPVPEDISISGKRIVIGYNDASWLKYHARRMLFNTRTREEAFRLALKIVDKYNARGTSFEQLVQQYSDHEDANIGGDIGFWSTREPADFPRCIEALAQTTDGAVSPPIDSPIGFQLLLRTSHPPETKYAQDIIRFDFHNGTSDNDPYSYAQTEARARTALAAVMTTPSLFSAFQKEYCCTGTEVWTTGHAALPTLETLRSLAVGQVSSTIIIRNSAIYIVKRVDPADVPKIRFTLPNPQEADLSRAVMRDAPDRLAGTVLELMNKGIFVLHLKGETLDDFRHVHQELAAQLATAHRQDRPALLEKALRQLRQVLNEDDYQIYTAFVNKWVTARMLNGGS